MAVLFGAVKRQRQKRSIDDATYKGNYKKIAILDK
jgi:hypothetical protein